MIAVVFVSIMLIIALGFLNYVFSARKSAVNITSGVQARYLAETGLEKAVWQLNQDDGFAGESAVDFGGGQYTTVITAVDSNTKKVAATGAVPSFNSNRSIQQSLSALVSIDKNLIAFNYAVQVGEGGFHLENNATIEGNIYANGAIIGTGGNIITGDAISAGNNGKIEGGNGANKIQVTGHARAKELKNCQVGGNGYYQIISSCTIGGTASPGSPNPETRDLPVTTEQINQWKADAEAGGINNGDLTINNNATLGPKKVAGNLVVGSNVTLTLTGRVWVTGQITMNNGAILELTESYEDDSEVILADGRIVINNNVVIRGTSDPESYIIVLSESSSLDQNSPAVDVNNNTSSALFYARFGVVRLRNNVEIAAVTANKVWMDQNVNLVYSAGLADASFSSGPGAAWAFAPGTYVSE